MYTTINPLKSLLPTNQHRYMDAKLRAELHSCSSLILYFFVYLCIQKLIVIDTVY